MSHIVSLGTLQSEWCETRQLLNDAGMSDMSMPDAVALLLSKSRHPSRRRLTAVES